MKRTLLLTLIFCMPFVGCDTAKQILDTYGSSLPGGLSNADIVAGLKEALEVGTSRTSNQLSTADGFFKDAAIKILMPEEAKKVESTLRSVGLGSVVDKAILTMNRGAEDAAKGASTIFINAVKQMTITDAVNILKGGDFAATNYFKAKTTAALTQSFRPVIENSLKNVEATKYWDDVFTVYNRFSTNRIDTDLTAYVTQKAMDGIFYQLGLEEQKIRKNPVARTSEILRKVFGSAMAQGN